MRTIGTATLITLLAISTLAGCDKIRAAKKAAETLRNAQANATAAQQNDDPDGALSDKLGEYIGCLNSATKAVSSSRGRYLTWADETKGPTGKENNILGLYAINEDNCLQSLDKAKTLPPSLPELEAAAATYKTALQELTTLVATANKYYDQNDYKDDKMAKGKEMHAPLLAAFAKFKAADKPFDDIVTRMNDELSARLLQKLEKDPSARLQYLTKKSLAQSKSLVNLVDISELKDLDATKYQAALDQLQTSVTELESYSSTHAAEVSKVLLFSTFTREEGDFLKAAKELARRKRDNKDFNKEFNANSNPQLVDGHPAQVIDKYNSMIRRSNSLRF
jgi:hypothetical protein